MAECTDKDLVDRKARWLLWGIPSAMIVAGSFVAVELRTWLWTAAFTAAGAACVLNAARCRRTHCYITGPLFLVLALASALEGAGLISIGWAWIGVAAVVGVAVAYRVERARGKYAHP